MCAFPKLGQGHCAELDPVLGYMADRGVSQHGQIPGLAGDAPSKQNQTVKLWSLGPHGSTPG